MAIGGCGSRGRVIAGCAEVCHPGYRALLACRLSAAAGRRRDPNCVQLSKRRVFERPHCATFGDLVGEIVRRFRSTQSNWPIYTSLILFGFLIGGGMVMGIYKFVYGSSIGGDALAPEASVMALPTPTTGPAPKIIRVAEDPIVTAKKVKPLADVQKDDLVIYQGITCSWVQWNGNVNSSVIKCPGRAAFRTNTIQLMPVQGH
jgi:hypothetical protein